ncbi:MAG: dTDP-glucose 4,6-dehydratase [Thermoplasmata archaeon]|uniref:dTDP-glucose 4,6-dehydratase n=1 Tax=Candidatus Sysuiplasma superficiale TaxID=2823368 RepID=A0A8J7YQK1_9ARCH|nr:dTDP-glucose 4,6-dehydratase [Candidatus Sysuiplasma superficiale]MBX8644895.1 dTDP-glucose 4,6-dehydratase [Candidatus Sysuiplasma superficiale]
MNVLVTGGAGFIGSNLLHYWSREHPEDRITCLDKLTYAGHLESIRDIIDDGRIEFIRGDICDERIVSETVKGKDIIIHLAAESHVDRSISAPDVFIRTNVLGTLTLLEAALKCDVGRFHHVSTDEVFGSLSLDSNEKFNEDTCYRPRSPYSASKASSDHLVRAYVETYGLNATISNCGNNFGPFQHPEKLIPRSIALLLEGKKVPLYGDGLNVRDWIFVEDHCSAIDTVISRGKRGETYLVSGRNELSNIELVRRILRLLDMGEDRIEFIRDRPGHDRRYAIDDTKIRSELGWHPSRGFDEALRETVDWYRRNKWWCEKVNEA